MPGTDPRAVAKAALRRARMDLRVRRHAGRIQLEFHHPAITARKRSAPAVPKLFNDPVDALHYCYGGKPASFVCPIAKCVYINGLNFSDAGWHPFSATLTEYARGAIGSHVGSTLQRYYERWQPSNLLEAYIGLDRSIDSGLHALPAHLAFLYPWSAKSTHEADELIRQAAYNDHVEHGRPDLTVADHGFQCHGPVSEALMRLEFERLVHVYESIAEHGYARKEGDVRGLVIRRGDDYRFLLSGGGAHRVPAMQILGYDAVPATFNNVPTIFDVADAVSWPQVADGPWSEAAARDYVDHLFDFDAHAWAERLQLVDLDRTATTPQGQAAPVAARTFAAPLYRTR